MEQTNFSTVEMSLKISIYARVHALL